LERGQGGGGWMSKETYTNFMKKSILLFVFFWETFDSSQTFFDGTYWFKRYFSQFDNYKEQYKTVPSIQKRFFFNYCGLLPIPRVGFSLSL
jgi:hypothetical protein